MTTERSSKSQPTGEDSIPKKQDPLERRRQQNRLSQRNHRRKIRDRIAKLQERVIANELRAVAALNGWDNSYGPSPLTSPVHSACSPFLDVELGLASPSPPSLSTTPTTPFISSNEFSSTPLFLMDSSLEPNPLVDGHAHPFNTPTDLSLPSSVSNFGIPLAVYNGQDNDSELLHQSRISLEEGLSDQPLVNDKNPSSAIDPVLLYVATGTLTRSPTYH
ncbi:hypothetical protein N7528_004052 [Penicillium herquei]|nr:hypothetical protein N7528_004052 [Penicillium herquei]